MCMGIHEGKKVHARRGVHNNNNNNNNNGYSTLGLVWQEPEPSQATGMALVRCILGKLLRVVCHCFPPRLDVPTFAARCLHVLNDSRDPGREWWNYGRERLSGNFAYMASLFSPLGIFYIAANLQHGTDGFTSPPKEGALRIFFALKNPTTSAEFEPANLGTKGQHDTPRQPKPLCGVHRSIILKWISKVG